LPESKGGALNAQVLAALGLPTDADAARVLSAVAELKATVEERPGLEPQYLDDFRDMASVNVEYERRKHELEIEERHRTDEERRERLLAVAVAEGRIRESDTDALRALYSISPEAVKDVLLSVPGPDASRDLREIINAAGEVVDARTDSDWLHRRVTAILVQKGITEPIAEEYAEALNQALASTTDPASSS
jgi:hypothetical protein